MKELRFLLLFAFSSLLMTGCIPSMSSAMKGPNKSNPAGPRKGSSERKLSYYPHYHEAKFYTDNQTLFVVFEKYNSFIEFELSALSDEHTPNRKNMVKAKDARTLSDIDLSNFKEIKLGSSVYYDPALDSLRINHVTLPEPTEEAEIYLYFYNHYSPHKIWPRTVSFCVRNEKLGIRFIYIKQNTYPVKRDASGNLTL